MAACCEGRSTALSEEGHATKVVNLAGHIIKPHPPFLQPPFLKLVLGLRSYVNIAISSWDKGNLIQKGHISPPRRPAMSLYVPLPSPNLLH
jgi:hypothetical protein